jgi:hypothetical protein
MSIRPASLTTAFRTTSPQETRLVPALTPRAGAPRAPAPSDVFEPVASPAVGAVTARVEARARLLRTQLGNAERFGYLSTQQAGLLHEALKDPGSEGHLQLSAVSARLDAMLEEAVQDPSVRLNNLGERVHAGASGKLAPRDFEAAVSELKCLQRSLIKP